MPKTPFFEHQRQSPRVEVERVSSQCSNGQVEIMDDWVILDDSRDEEESPGHGRHAPHPTPLRVPPRTSATQCLGPGQVGVGGDGDSRFQAAGDWFVADDVLLQPPVRSQKTHYSKAADGSDSGRVSGNFDSPKAAAAGGARIPGVAEGGSGLQGSPTAGHREVGAGRRRGEEIYSESGSRRGSGTGTGEEGRSGRGRQRFHPDSPKRSAGVNPADLEMRMQAILNLHGVGQSSSERPGSITPTVAITPVRSSNGNSNSNSNSNSNNKIQPPNLNSATPSASSDPFRYPQTPQSAHGSLHPQQSPYEQPPSPVRDSRTDAYEIQQHQQQDHHHDQAPHTPNNISYDINGGHHHHQQQQQQQQQQQAGQHAHHAQHLQHEPMQAAYGAWSPLNFVESTWRHGWLSRSPPMCSDLPNVGLDSGGQGRSSGYKLVTSVSPVLMDLGPRALQQDEACVEGLPGGVPLIVVCDGHGSVPLFGGLDPASTPADVRDIVHVGGRQCSRVACDGIVKFMRSHAAEFELRGADKFFHRAFVHAHNAVLDEIRKGSRGGDTDEDAANSAVDGAYFKNQAKLAASLRTDSFASVCRKVTRPCPTNGPGGDVTFYQRNSGAWEHCDFGTTATAVCVLNAPDAARPHRKVALTAHAGDSDVCLLRFGKGDKGHLQMAKWLTQEHNMYSAAERSRPIAWGRRLVDVEGQGKLIRKVRVDVRLPNDDISAVAYEPTRGLGHCQGQFCGIVPSPTVSCVEVEAEDILLVGSDGLWNALGGRRARDDTSECEEDLVGPLLQSIRQIMAHHRHKEAHEIAREMMGAARAKGLVDNITVVAIKMGILTDKSVKKLMM